MKREDISNALGGIADKYIEEAAEGPSVQRRTVLTLLKKWLPAAACVVLAAGLGLSMLGGPDKSENKAPEAVGESSAPTASGEETDTEEMEPASPADSPSVQVKLIGREEDGLRAVITGVAGTGIFPVGTEVILDLGEVTFLPSSSLSGGERPDQSLPPDNLWMIPADYDEEMEIMFDSWEQEGTKITLHVDQLVILN